MAYGINYGFDREQFFVDFKSCSRPAGNMREEHERRAVEIANESDKICVCLSSGVDSQSILHSFYNLGVDFETAFLYLKGYNDNELEQLRVLEKKYSITTNIVELDIIELMPEINNENVKLDTSIKNSILQKEFVRRLPDDWDVVQMPHDPFVWVNPDSGNSYFFIGYYSPEISRERAFSSLTRTGRHYFWCETPEFTLSILGDEVFQAAIHTAKYFDGNGVTHPDKYLNTVDRWDFYIKPLIYGKYWKDELIYFPKYGGVEKIPNFSGNPWMRKHAVVTPYFNFIEFLKQPNKTMRVYDNVPFIKLHD